MAKTRLQFGLSNQANTLVTKIGVAKTANLYTMLCKQNCEIPEVDVAKPNNTSQIITVDKAME